jgi:methyl farnesoate epoxidase/farnesoate epoxidase
LVTLGVLNQFSFVKSGPRGLPLLGYLSPVLSKKESFFKAMQKLAKKYGPVTGFYLGPNQPLISVVGTEAVREALQNKDLNGRLCGALQLHSLTFGERLGINNNCIKNNCSF